MSDGMDEVQRRINEEMANWKGNPDKIEIARLTAEVEKLRAALRSLEAKAITHHQENVVRAEWGGSDIAYRKAKAVLSRSGILLSEIRSIVRAALDGKR